MSVRSEALPYVLPLALAAALALALGHVVVALALALLSGSLAAFFRDPPRQADAPATVVVSPADGRVVAVDDTDNGMMIAIFLALWNVHVTRSPVDGELLSAEFHPGGFAPAFRPGASENARWITRLRSSGQELELALIAGFVARRVVPWVDAGDEVRRSQRIALVRFGSRAEIRLPVSYRASVSVGDRVKAGETPIAHRQDGEVRGR